MAKIRENIEKIHETVGALKKNVSLTEPLEKASKKQLLQQLGSDPQAAEVAEWLSKDIKRDDVQQWFLRGYKKDPKIWNPQNKEAVQHYVGTAGTNPDHDIGKIRFDKTHSFDDGMKLWKDAEDSLKNKKKDAANLLKPDDKTRKIIDLGNGWGWYDLGKGYDAAEGKAMAHCGNANAQGAEDDDGHPNHHDRILSLRKEHNINGETYHEPRLSFIDNHGYIGESKGFGNSKPAAKYHDAIIQLLKHPRIKENVGGGYAPSNNFYLNDLPKDKLDKLLKDKPGLEKLWKLSSGEIDPAEYPYKHIEEAKYHNKALQDLKNGEENINQARFRDIDPRYAKAIISNYIDDFNDDHGFEPQEAEEAAQPIMRSPHLDKSHVDQAFGVNKKELLRYLLSSHAATKDHISRALDHEDESVRLAAVRSPRFSKEHMDKAFNDESGRVREASVQSPHFGPEHFDKAFNDKSPYVRMAAVDSPRFSKEHMDKALNDEAWLVRRAAVKSPHFSKEHFDKALNDEDADVREAATESPHYQTYLKQKGLAKTARTQALKKDAAERLQPLAGIPYGIHDVEVHPLVDHLKRVKGIIGDKPSMKVRDLSKLVTPDIMKHVPRDAKGNVTPQGIDDHIDSLPKFKVRAEVGPYTWQSQMHHPGAQEDVMSVHIHPDAWSKMDDRTKAHFKEIEARQHNFDHGPNQMGWARIDQRSGPQNHLHIDEIQSDFVNHDKIKDKSSSNFNDVDSVNNMHEFLSHGHNDPQHLIHSVVNELGRRHGINSVSMDTPGDQAEQSGLQGNMRPQIEDLINDQVAQHPDFIADHDKYYNEHLDPHAIESQRKNAPNPYLRSALKKIDDDTLDKVKEYARQHSGDSEPTADITENLPALNHLSEPEKHAFQEFMSAIDNTGLKPHPYVYWHLAHPALLAQFLAESAAMAEIKSPVTVVPPVHQIDTYNKRPKKLGFTDVPKQDLMPEHSEPDQEVQYSKLYKMIKALSAGYGGAGSPTDLTGGGVLQAESVEGSRSFKYIDCPNCGKEQPYMKYQVKCRSCGKSLPFDTLAKFFLSSK